ncbi:atherin-like [Elephas maximus indicus]|uniref:atherin-like n=1 Tax=Elephas maximus indicus TaxID=99487 RepID=UPI0021165582|nr:atherin-like [Elephas maximus indicus]
MGAPRPASTKPRPRVPAAASGRRAAPPPLLLPPPPPRCDVCFELASRTVKVVATELSEDSCRGEKRETRVSARGGGAGLPAPGEGKHAPTHAPPRAPKITRAARRPPRGKGAPSPRARGSTPRCAHLDNLQLSINPAMGFLHTCSLTTTLLEKKNITEPT